MNTIKEREEEKMTKKKKKVQNNTNRVFIYMNTGTRTHKTKKDYNRKENKKICRKALTEY